MPRVVALALPEVVAFDLAIPAQVFGHRDERLRYSFTTCSVRPGTVPSTTGHAVEARCGLGARRLLEGADLPVDQVAARCGRGSAGNLRLHLARDAATTPTAYRRTYRGRPEAGIKA